MNTTSNYITKGPETMGAGASLSFGAARLSFVSAFVSLFLMLILHLVKPGLSPASHMLSEYAIGDQGWIMKLAFFAWAASCLLLVMAIRSYIHTMAGKIGLVLLFIVGLSLVMAGIFVMDPPTASPEELTTHGNLHGLSAMIGIPGHAIAALLISFSLKQNPEWFKAKTTLVRFAHFTWISLLLLFASVFIMMSQSGGKFTGDNAVGWFNRLLVFSYCAWLIVTARNAIAISKTNGSPGA